MGFSQLSPAMYHYMTAQLKQICPKLYVVQEGGYNIDFMGQHANGVVSALLNLDKVKGAPT
jgi:acetoin utilization deacetylase AcuC-like enzyme